MGFIENCFYTLQVECRYLSQMKGVHLFLYITSQKLISESMLFGKQDGEVVDSEVIGRIVKLQ